MNAAHAFTMIESAVMIAELRRRIGRLFNARTDDGTAAAQALVDTLIGRVDHLESENSRLTIENEKLKRELDEVRDELRRLERYIVKHKVGDDDA